MPEWNAAAHGGNPSRVMSAYPHAPKPWIDLSTGINPYGIPLPEAQPEDAYRLPEAAAMQAATEAAARYYQVDSNRLLLASGMQPLLVALAAWRLREYGRARAGVIAPSYSEHARIWQAVGHQVEAAEEPSEAVDVQLICNPNNPDARCFDNAALCALADRMARRGGWLIVDESFMDITPEQSLLVSMGERQNVIVLRSCGKFFGIAGMRVSALILPPNLVGPLREMIGPWPISTAACRLLPTIFLDVSWQGRMRRILQEESVAWSEELKKCFNIIGSHPLFTLVANDDAAACYRHLASQGIVVRAFDKNPHWLRFGLPHRDDVSRIKAALEMGW